MSDDKVAISNEGNTLTMKKGAMMARKKATDVIEADEDIELEELEVLDEVNEEADVSDSTGMLSAKAAATALGTDGRTLRKFLRKKNGVLGQGKRWEIDPDDLDDLRAEFAAFSKPKAKEVTEMKPAKGKKVTTPAPDPIYDDIDEDEDLDMEALEEIEGPDEDELEEIEFDEDE